MLKKCIHNSTYSKGRLNYTWDIFLNMLKSLVAFNCYHFIGYLKRPTVIVSGVSDFQGKLKVRNYNDESLKLVANNIMISRVIVLPNIYLSRRL